MSGRNADPRFRDLQEGQFAPIEGESPLIGASRPATLELRGTREWWSLPGDQNIGSVKGFDEAKRNDVPHEPADLDCPQSALPTITEAQHWPGLTQVKFPE